MNEELQELRATGWALLLVVLHTVVVSAHSATHVALSVKVPNPLSADGVFIALVYFVVPILWLVEKKERRPRWSGPLFIAFAAGLAYGAALHFFLPGADNVERADPGAWGDLFVLTSVLLWILEGAVAALAWLLWRASRPRPAPTL